MLSGVYAGMFFRVGSPQIGNFLRQERWADVRDGPAPAARLEDFAPAAEPGQPSAGERTGPLGSGLMGDD